MSTEDNKVLVRRYFANAWNKRNPELVDEVFAADYVDHSPDVPGIPHTREGLKQFMSMYLRAFPDVSITVEDQLADGDRVVTRWTGRGTQTGQFMDMPPSGKTAIVSGVQIDRFAGDKIVESWILFDQLGLLQQLGAIPAPKQPAIAAP